MNKKYKLIVDEREYNGYFFYDEAFGFYFIVKQCELDLTAVACNLLISGMTVTIEIAKNRLFKVYEAVDGFIFALVGNFNIASVNYLTYEDLLSDEIDLTSDEVAEYLAAIGHLPNGNYVVASVQNYITAIEEITAKYPDREAFFRGHYSYRYLLVPSLYRKKKYYDNEAMMYMDFKTQFYNELAGKKYIEILTTMQHYSMKTRLLDTTSNPLVALYMACDNPTNHIIRGINAGEVVIMEEEYKNVKYSDSNAVTMLSCLAVLETPLKQELYEKIAEAKAKNDPSIYRNCVAYKRYIAELHNELPCIEEALFNPEILFIPKHVKVGMINERIISQSGNFILFGLCNYETGEYTKLNTVTKERVFIVNRDKITKQLLMLNINDGTMYPDKDHISTAITKHLDILK